MTSKMKQTTIKVPVSPRIMSVAATRFAHAEGRVCLAYKSDGEKVGGRGG